MYSVWLLKKINAYITIILFFVLFVPPIYAQKPERFTIFMWPYKTDVLKDYNAYNSLGIKGIQIDRGRYQQKRVDFAKNNNLLYYVGHLADKGFLYLKEKKQNAVSYKKGLATRPFSLADPKTVKKNEIPYSKQSACGKRR